MQICVSSYHEKLISQTVKKVPLPYVSDVTMYVISYLNF